MRNFFVIAAVAVFAINFAAPVMLSGADETAQASEYCKSASSCISEVRQHARNQDAAASGGPWWGPVGPNACAIASREQEGNERRCRSYDAKPGGKTYEECAKCYRQVREDIARWEQCSRAGLAPRPPRAIYESLARLGLQASKY